MTSCVDLSNIIAIARKHGFAPPSVMPAPWTGGSGQVFPCGDVVIKIPFDRPDAIQSVKTDAGMVSVVHSLGVAAPARIAFDDSLDILSVPYAVFERVHGAVTLDACRVEGTLRSEAWAEAGRQLARVHAVRDAGGVPIALRTFRQSPEVDPRPWVSALHDAGLLNGVDARLLHDLLERLAPDALADLPLVLCHGDVNAANVLVDQESGRFRALIDWGGSGWRDPAWDFAGVSLAVVPAILAGHRSIAPMVDDRSAEARVLWCQVQMRLYPLREATASVATGEALGRHIDQVRRFAYTVGLA